MRTVWVFLSALVCLASSGCEKYYASVTQQWIDVRYLASTHVKTPDPRQAHPPIGQMLVVDWRVPKSLLKKNPQVQLTMIFWDFTEKTICFPIEERMGWVTYSLLNEEYDKTGGIITYKAEILDEDGSLFREWKHQLWVELIVIRDEEQVPETFEEEEGEWENKEL
ncbi:MAG: hypothetical protein HYZ48_00375 [Chlamydiales bacterium]|nr:hypothetical protein [Chlamydiales bacterium]